jgi:hypothetical protein
LARAGVLAETDSERTCIVTRQIRAPAEMLRFVVGPDESGVPDRKRKVRASATLPDDIDRLLEQNALQSLSICNKAGLVSTGAAKVEKAIASAPIAAMVHATDGGPDGIRKIGQALTRAYGEAAASVPRIILFASSQLDLALGRSNVIHAALKSGAASKAFLERCRHLAHYRGEIGAEIAPSMDLTTAEMTGSDADSGPVEAGADDRK